MLNHLKLCLAPLVALLVGCASHPETSAAPAVPKAAMGPCDARKDQAALLEMAGSFDVDFNFEETTVLTAGYQKRPSSKTDATELVLLLDNTPGHVSLQHVLVVGSTVVKHWRQDWTFEDRELLEFQGNRSWVKATLPFEAARCTWSQAVFEVDDSPRYEGFGRFSHLDGEAVWESNETWRPLPRREYTKRQDYDVLVGINRHRISAAGWKHEQENAKLVLDPRHMLVRERGLNRYTRTTPAATSTALHYWQGTGEFWRLVRGEWAQVINSRPRLDLRWDVDGKRLYEHLFERAQATSHGTDETAAFIHEAIARYAGGATP